MTQKKQMIDNRSGSRACKLVLVRLATLKDRTLGRLIVFSGTDVAAVFATLELPWRNNDRNISCIPRGTYSLSKLRHNKFGHTLHVLGVKNRDGILFHAGNFPKQTRGCILVGESFKDIDNDAAADVFSSRVAMRRLFDIVDAGATLTIV